MSRKVAIVYPFFAHYRKAVLEELAFHSQHTYTFVGDRNGIDGIKTWKPPRSVRFIPTKSIYWKKQQLWQRGVLAVAVRSSVDTLIFLGNAAWPSTWIAGAAGRLLGKRVIFWTHGYTSPSRGIRDAFRTLFYRIPHSLLLYGHMAKMWAIDAGLPAERLHVIYNSLDYALQQAARSATGPEQIQMRRQQLFPHTSYPIVICTGRLVAAKRLDILIRAAQLLAEKSKPVSILLVGDGPERDSLARAAANASVSLHIFGECYDEDRLSEMFMLAAVTVVPGKLGLTAMHSLAFGTPVITHGDLEDQMPESEAVVEGRTGSFFTKGDAASLAAAIERWTHPSGVADVSKDCIQMVETYYNPKVQAALINAAVSGFPADDLFVCSLTKSIAGA